MHRVGGVNGFGILTICLFFTFFLGMVIYVIRLKKPYVTEMSELPLAEDAAPNTLTTSNPERPNE